MNKLYVACLRDICDFHHIKMSNSPFTKKELLKIYPEWLCLQFGVNIFQTIQEAQ